MAMDVMGFILNNLWESFGQIVAWAAEVHYYEQGGHKRADWGHPVYVQFRHMAGATRAHRFYSDTKDRLDAGGERTLKLECSSVEFRLDQGEHWDDTCARRVSANRDIDWFTADAFLTVVNEPRLEAMWKASEDWPCNVGLPHRAYNNARSGTLEWRTDG